MTLNLKKPYKFDELLISLDIQYIDHEIVNKYYQEIECDRCKYRPLVHINIIRIDANYYNIGNDCYESIRAQLSKIRGKSLVHLKRELEDKYEEYLMIVHPNVLGEIEGREDSINKNDPDYRLYLTLKWDAGHGSLPKHRIDELARLREKYKS